MTGSPHAVYAIAWHQTEIDGVRAAPVSSLGAGAQWRWGGDPVLLSRRPPALRLTQPAGDRARRGAMRLLHDGAPANRDAPVDALGELDLPRPHDAMLLTDGQNQFPMRVVPRGAGTSPIVVNDGPLPPRGRPLWVVYGPASGADTRRAPPPPPGIFETTQVATPGGTQALASLKAGDLVTTIDGGPQPVLWIGTLDRGAQTRWCHPFHGAAETRLAPGQFVWRADRGATAVFGPAGVLVRAQSLSDPQQAPLDTPAPRVIFLARHALICCVGGAVDSFHPAGGGLGRLTPGARADFAAEWPGLADDPGLYGAPARRRLRPGETALLPKPR